MVQQQEHKRLIEPETLRQLARAVGSRLRELRRAKGWTQAQAAEKMGVQTVTLRRWELGLSAPSRATLRQLTDLYDADFDEVAQLAKVPTMTQLQVRGYVAAGTPRDACDADLGTLPCPPSLLQEYPHAYALIVSGNSLSGDGITDGDTVVVDPDAGLEAGRLYVVRIGEEVVARHLVIDGGRVRLRASNDSYQDLTAQSAQVLGRVVYHYRRM